MTTSHEHGDGPDSGPEPAERWRRTAHATVAALLVIFVVARLPSATDDLEVVQAPVQANNYLNKRDKALMNKPKWPRAISPPDRCPPKVCRGKDYVAEKAIVREVARCTTIRGNVYVGGEWLEEDVREIFHCLEHINGSLEIGSEHQKVTGSKLTSMDGFENLRSVTNLLEIHQNANLKNLDGLRNLEHKPVAILLAVNKLNHGLFGECGSIVGSGQSWDGQLHHKCKDKEWCLQKDEDAHSGWYCGSWADANKTIAKLQAAEDQRAKAEAAIAAAGLGSGDEKVDPAAMAVKIQGTVKLSGVTSSEWDANDELAAACSATIASLISNNLLTIKPKQVTIDSAAQALTTRRRLGDLPTGVVSAPLLVAFTITLTLPQSVGTADTTMVNGALEGVDNKKFRTMFNAAAIKAGLANVQATSAEVVLTVADPDAGKTMAATGSASGGGGGGGAMYGVGALLVVVLAAGGFVAYKKANGDKGEYDDISSEEDSDESDDHMNGGGDYESGATGGHQQSGEIEDDSSDEDADEL